MKSSKQFSLATVLALLITLLKYVGSPKEIVRYLRDNKGVTKGIVMFTGILGGVAMFSQSCEAKWFNYADVYLGIDHTKNHSPQCEYGDKSDRATSNGGVVLNVYQSTDERFDFNTKYTHHSCAFNADATGYDAVGFELRYRIPLEFLHNWRG